MINISLTSCQVAEPDIRVITGSVFIHEPGIPAELEWDDPGQDILHLLAITPEHGAAATTRLLPGGHAGRMAVLANRRDQGIVSLLLATLMTAA